MARRLDELVADDDMLVVKCHGPLRDDIRELLLSGRAKATVTWRDPRDAAVSLRDVGRWERKRPKKERRPGFAKIRTMKQAMGVSARHLKHLVPWLEFDPPLKVPYPFLTGDPFSAAERIAEFLEVRADSESIVRRYLDDSSLITEFNVGRSGRHEEVMSPRQLRACEQLFGDFMKTWGPALGSQ